MRRRSPQAAPAIWLLLTAAAFAACTAGPSTDGGSTPQAGGGTTPATTWGTATATATGTASASSSPRAPVVELPAGFPVLPGAVRERLRPTDEPAVIARWSSDQVGPVAYNFYIDALPAAGFPITGLFPGGAVAVILFQTPSGDSWELALTGDDGLTLIVVRLAQP